MRCCSSRSRSSRQRGDRACCSRPRSRTRPAASSTACRRRVPSSSKTASPQTLDMVTREAMPATFTLLVDSSQSMSRRMDFVRQAAARLAKYLAPQDRVIVAPFSHTLGTITGPTDDLETLTEAIGAIEPRRHRDPRLAARGAELLGRQRGRRAIVLSPTATTRTARRAIEDALQAVQASPVRPSTWSASAASPASRSRASGARGGSRSRPAGGVFFPSRDDGAPVASHDRSRPTCTTAT